MNIRVFTLIELLVVIAIIGLLSSVVMASLRTAREKSRDSKRLRDLKELQTALYFYYNDNNAFPGSTGHYAKDVPCGGIGTLWESALSTLVSSEYISSLPEDPGGNCYTYTRMNPSGVFTGWRCYTQSGNQIDPNDYYYLITFQPEQSVDNSFLRLNSPTGSRYCLLGPQKL